MHMKRFVVVDNCGRMTATAATIGDVIEKIAVDGGLAPGSMIVDLERQAALNMTDGSWIPGQFDDVKMMFYPEDEAIAVTDTVVVPVATEACSRISW